MHFLCIVPQDDFVGRRSISSSSVATSLMDDTSPESTVGKKSTKKFPLHCNNYVNQAIWKKKKSFLSLLLSICCFEVSICKLDSFLFFFLPQQRPPCSCPYPRHPSQSGVRPPRGDTPLRRRPRPMFDSFCRPPNTAPSLWWVYAAFPQSSAFHLRWFRPSGRAVQWLALLPHKKMGCGFNSYAWGRLELAGFSRCVCIDSLLALRLLPTEIKDSNIRLAKSQTHPAPAPVTLTCNQIMYSTCMQIR